VAAEGGGWGPIAGAVGAVGPERGGGVAGHEATDPEGGSATGGGGGHRRVPPLPGVPVPPWGAAEADVSGAVVWVPPGAGMSVPTCPGWRPSKTTEELEAAWEQAFAEFEAYWKDRPVGQEIVVVGRREYEALRKAGWV
jgi:hypothetical protein